MPWLSSKVQNGTGSAAAQDYINSTKNLLCSKYRKKSDNSSGPPSNKDGANVHPNQLFTTHGLTYYSELEPTPAFSASTSLISGGTTGTDTSLIKFEVDNAPIVASNMFLRINVTQSGSGGAVSVFTIVVAAGATTAGNFQVGYATHREPQKIYWTSGVAHDSDPTTAGSGLADLIEALPSCIADGITSVTCVMPGTGGVFSITTGDEQNGNLLGTFYIFAATEFTSGSAVYTDGGPNALMLTTTGSSDAQFLHPFWWMSSIKFYGNRGNRELFELKDYDLFNWLGSRYYGDDLDKIAALYSVIPFESNALFKPRVPNSKDNLFFSNSNMGSNYHHRVGFHMSDGTYDLIIPLPGNLFEQWDHGNGFPLESIEPDKYIRVDIQFRQGNLVSAGTTTVNSVKLLFESKAMDGPDYSQLLSHYLQNKHTIRLFASTEYVDDAKVITASTEYSVKHTHLDDRDIAFTYLWLRNNTITNLNRDFFYDVHSDSTLDFKDKHGRSLYDPILPTVRLAQNRLSMMFPGKYWDHEHHDSVGQTHNIAVWLHGNPAHAFIKHERVKGLIHNGEEEYEFHPSASFATGTYDAYWISYYWKEVTRLPRGDFEVREKVHVPSAK